MLLPLVLLLAMLKSLLLSLMCPRWPLPLPLSLSLSQSLRCPAVVRALDTPQSGPLRTEHAEFDTFKALCAATCLLPLNMCVRLLGPRTAALCALMMHSCSDRIA